MKEMKTEEENPTPTIFLVSDSTGETAEKMLKAALAQFTNSKPALMRNRYIRTDEQIMEVIDEAKAQSALIIFTFVSHPLRMKIREGALNAGLFAVDLLGPLLTAMSHYLQKPAHADPGRLHRTDNEYFARVEAVQFTVKHDDGQNLYGISNADAVLVGPSRTAKTPLSFYLARFGYKVANIPLVLNLPIPSELSEVNPARVIALMIDPKRLMEIRLGRIKKLKTKVPNYADIESIVQELKFCRELYNKNPGWKVVDVTGRAVEEVATEVMTSLRKKKTV